MKRQKNHGFEEESVMTSEIRNLKGEIIQDPDDEKWYQLSTSTWLLIGGLILFNIGWFLGPSLIDSIFRLLDVRFLLDIRLWPWYYFGFLLIVATFSVRWYIIYRAFQDDFDMPDNPDELKAFVLLTGTITAFLLTYVILEQTLALKYLLLQLWKWMTLGAFSWSASLFFFGVLGSIGAFGALTKHWIGTWRFD